MTVKSTLPGIGGPPAVKSTSTWSPGLTEHELRSSTVNPVELSGPPPVPDWKHSVSVSSIKDTLVGAVPRELDGVMVMALPAALESGPVAMNLTSKTVVAVATIVLGEATTLPTELDGEPIAYWALLTSA
jgi:hypothetical protein